MMHQFLTNSCIWKIACRLYFAYVAGSITGHRIQGTWFPTAQCLKVNAFDCNAMESSASFRSFMQACAWSSADERMDLFYTWQSYDEDDTSIINTTSYAREFCSLGAWAAFRVGPFTTSGGFSWNSAAALISNEYMDQHTYRNPSIYAFTHYTLGNVNIESQLIGYPPIHQHHFHLFGSGSAFIQDMNNHGDNQCHAAEGGVRCLARSAPEGFAWMLVPRVGFVTEFNDVRRNGSENWDTWVFVAFKFADARLQLRQILLTRHSVSPSKHPQMYLVARRGTFQIPTAEDFVGWSHRVLGEEVDRIIECYFHTHAPMVQDVWLFQGNPSQVFANLSAAEPARGDLVSGQEAFSSLHSNILRKRVDPEAADLTCSYKDASRTEMVCEGRRCAEYYRKARCNLDATRKDLVMVAFLRRQKRGLPAQFRMHVALRIYHAGARRKALLPSDSALTRDQLLFTVRNHGDLLRDPLAQLSLIVPPPVAFEI